MTFDEAKKKWDQFGYSKYSGAVHWLEWSIIEAIIVQDHLYLNYVQSSSHEYPCLPDDLEETSKVVLAAEKARNILLKFETPNRESYSTERIYYATIADHLESHLLDYIELPYSRYAGNLFLRHAIADEVYFNSEPSRQNL